MVCLSKQFRSTIVVYRRPSTPGVRRPLVWPLASSLATTKAIEFSFFSSGYLDVSLPRVPPTELLIHSAVTGHYPGRVPPFGYSRINAYLQLPVTFRSLSRPSSAISALASTLRSYSLDLCQPPFTLLRLLGELQFFSVSFRILLTSSFLPYLCSFQGAVIQYKSDNGGLEWTRTTDLSLIRRVL